MGRQCISSSSQAVILIEAVSCTKNRPPLYHRPLKWFVHRLSFAKCKDHVPCLVKPAADHYHDLIANCVQPAATLPIFQLRNPLHYRYRPSPSSNPTVKDAPTCPPCEQRALVLSLHSIFCPHNACFLCS